MQVDTSDEAGLHVSLIPGGLRRARSRTCSPPHTSEYDIDKPLQTRQRFTVSHSFCHRNRLVVQEHTAAFPWHARNSTLSYIITYTGMVTLPIP